MACARGESLTVMSAAPIAPGEPKLIGLGDRFVYVNDCARSQVVAHCTATTVPVSTCAYRKVEAAHDVVYLLADGGRNREGDSGEDREADDHGSAEERVDGRAADGVDGDESRTGPRFVGIRSCGADGAPGWRGATILYMPSGSRLRSSPTHASSRSPENRTPYAISSAQQGPGAAIASASHSNSPRARPVRSPAAEPRLLLSLPSRTMRPSCQLSQRVHRTPNAGWRVHQDEPLETGIGRERACQATIAGRGSRLIIGGWVAAQGDTEDRESWAIASRRDGPVRQRVARGREASSSDVRGEPTDEGVCAFPAL